MAIDLDKLVEPEICDEEWETIKETISTDFVDRLLSNRPSPGPGYHADLWREYVAARRAESRP